MMCEKRKLTRRVFLKKGAFAAVTAGMAATFGYIGRSRSGYCLQSQIIADTESINQGSIPNIIIINVDDLGYGDLGCYGSDAIRTPHINRLADEGVRFTNFYACNALCSPSRFGLLTGRYPQRVGLHWVLWKSDLTFQEKWLRRLGRLMNKIGSTDIGAVSEVEGIPEDEITIAEGLKKAGYRTGAIGKWHLGDFRYMPEFNPRNHGFDYFYGLPWDHEENPCPLYKDHDCIMPVIDDYSKLHKLFADNAVRFIEQSKTQPFFLYYAPPDPHIPLFPSEEFKGKSKGGVYGDVVEEMDSGIGQILDAIRENGLEADTLILFTSDNGPWYHGSTSGLRGRKGQSYEGGFRVPMIARWPGHIVAGSVCDQPSMNIDFLPTCFSIAGVEIPNDRIIDGRDISALLTGEREFSPHDVLYFYHHDKLEGVRSGKWKFYRRINTYVYPVPVDHWRFDRGVWDGPWLYDLAIDPHESYPVQKLYPEVVKELLTAMERWETDMSDNRKGWR